MDVTTEGGLSRRQLQGDEVDFDALKLIKTNHDVHVRVSGKVELDGLPGECNLMAVSNTWGILVAGSSKDVRLHRLSEVHRLLETSPKDASPTSEPCATLSLPGRPVWIRLAANDEVLLVATQQPTAVQIYRLQDVVSGNTSAYSSVTTSLPDLILDLLPNPASPSTSEVLARTAALVTSEGLIMLDIESGRISPSLAGQLTCASWSPKGKQIVCGDRSGNLRQCTPEGVVKAEILPPPELGEGFYPTSVEWIENDIFLVSYKNASAEEDEPLSVFTIHRSKATWEIVYYEFFDPINTMGLPTRSGSHRFVAGLKQWGDSTRHLEFLISGRSSEVAVMRMTASDTPTWEALMLDETARGVMPAGKSGVSEDSSCIGLEFDLTSTKPIKLGLVGGVEVPDLPPAPRLLAYSHEGFIVSFDVRYEDAGGYPHMVEPKDIATSLTAPQSTETQMDTATPAASTPAPAPVSKPEQKPAFGGFGTSSTSGGFGASAFGKPASSTSTTSSGGFGASAFGKPAASQSPSTSGGFGQSAFGQPAASGSAFGQSAFGSSSATASTSKSPFGGSSSTPSFGASAFGQKSDTTKSSAPSNSAFGQSSTSSGFGQSAFGASPSTTPGGFGQSAFGQKTGSTPSTFGQSAFGSPSSPAAKPAFGTSAPSTSQSTSSSSPSPGFGQSAFGQKPAASPASSDKPAFGQSAFGQSSTPSPSAFGQTAFGQASKPSAFGQPATSSPSTSAFSSTTTPSTGGFAGFGQKPNGQSGGFSGFGALAFGQNKPASSSSFGSSGGGGGGGSAFGSSSAFGQSGFGAKPASSPFASNTATSTPPSDAKSPPAPAASGGFGLDGLGSALDSSKPGASGMDDTTPPDSPVGPSKSAPTAQAASANTPPDSPIFGAAKGLSGRDEDDDDSPPTTPKPAPTTTPAKPPPAAGSTSSFIKPATAFGSSSSASPSTSFGAFGQSSTPSSSSTVPNAFSKPASSATTPSSGFGSSAFGSSAFGKSSTPSATSAFGKPSAPPAIGNITGGFGGFAPKKADSPSGFAGFGGSTANPGKSAFGSSSTGGSAFSALLTGDKPKEAVKPAEQTPTEVKKEPEASTTPPATPQPARTTSASPPDAEVESTTPPSPPSAVVKQEEKTPEPQGYDVPSDEASETPDKPDAQEPSTSPSTRPAAVPPTPQPTEPESTDTSPSQAGEQDDRAADESPSSPELIEHEDAKTDDENRRHSAEGEEDEEADEEYSGEDDDGYSDEGHDDEEYDEEDEDEYEDEEEAEEGDEPGAEAEVEVKQESTSPDSSPPLSAATAPAASQAQAPQASDGSSLFSRLGPPTIGKHAVRTSSPLGSQPPQNATPPASPPKPPAVSSIKDASGSAPPPFFGGFNKPANPAPTDESIKLSPFASLGKGAPPPSLFGNAKPAEPTTSLFGKPQAPAPTVETANKTPFSFGLGKPSAPPTPATPATKEPEQKQSSFGFGTTPARAPAAPPSTSAAKSPFSFGSTPAPSTPASAPGPTSILGQKPPAQPAQTSSISIPATPAAPPVVDTGKYATPARTPVKESSQAQDDGSRQMAAVMSRMITDLMSEIKDMKDALAAHAEYHRGLEPKFNKVSIDDLDAHSDLPFSSLSDIAAVIDQLAADMSGVSREDKKIELRVLELQSKMVKTDMKSKQAERLVTAHDDATFAYHSQPQDLSSAQTEERASLCRRKQAAESKLEDLERSVERLKRTAAEGRPTIDKLHQSIEKVEAAIVDKQDLVEDLSMRIKSIRLSTPGSRRSLAPSTRAPQAQKTASASSLNIPPDVMADVERQIDQQARKPNFGGVKVARVTRPTNGPGGPVQMGKLPLPGSIDISALIQDEPEPETAVNVKQEEDKEDKAESKTDARPALGASTAPTHSISNSSTAAQASPSWPPAFNLSAPSGSGSPSPAFGGIKLSLDPGDLSASHTRTRAAVSGTRAHHSAPRFGTSPSTDKAPTGASPGTPLSSGFSFFPPPRGGESSPSTTTTGSSPKGFFSLSGYAQK